MSHLILEARWGSQDWELLGIADKNDIDKINRLSHTINSFFYPIQKVPEGVGVALDYFGYKFALETQTKTVIIKR